MRIAQYLNRFPDYLFQWGSPTPFSKIWEKPQKEHILLFSNSMTIHRKEFEKLLSKYYIAELFELSNCFLGNCGEPYMFLRIVDTPIDTVKISFYNKAPHVYRDDGDTFGYDKVRLAEKYTEEFGEYLGLLDDWMQTGNMPQGQKDVYEFRNIPYDEICRDFVYTRYYQRHNDKIRELLRNETVYRLADVADIEVAHLVNDTHRIAHVLFDSSVPSYPYIPEKDSVEYPATSIRLQKNDIVEYRGEFFLFHLETNMEIYAPLGTAVIRAKTMSPEYLYFYLSGKTAHQIKLTYSVIGGDYITPMPLRLQDFPVVLPTQDEQYYKDRFAQLAKPERVYEYIESTPGSLLASALKQECADRVNEKNNMLLQALVESDFAELKICFEHKAYKAAVILAGAVLEYFVLDWLSELDGVDYFSNDFYDANGKKTTELAAYVRAQRKSPIRGQLN